jgi:hypothetical protein
MFKLKPVTSRTDPVKASGQANAGVPVRDSRQEHLEQCRDDTPTLDEILFQQQIRRVGLFDKQHPLTKTPRPGVVFIAHRAGSAAHPGTNAAGLVWRCR